MQGPSSGIAGLGVELHADELRREVAEVDVDVEAPLARPLVDADLDEAEATPVEPHRLPPLLELARERRVVGPAPPVGLHRRQVGLLDVVADHPVGAEGVRQARHARPHPLGPAVRDPVLVAVVELGDDRVLHHLIELLGLDPVALVGHGVDAAAERPAHLGRVRLVPPSVEHREMEAAVDDASSCRSFRRLRPDDAAGSARRPRRRRDAARGPCRSPRGTRPCRATS
jgi:hypothetical protein